MAYPCNGKRLLRSPEDFKSWVEGEESGVVAEWASSALEDVAAVCADMLAQPPTHYPAMAVWKGIREFHWWFIYREDLDSTDDI